MSDDFSMKTSDNYTDLNSITDILPKISEYIAKRFHVHQDRADQLALNAETVMEAHGISLHHWETVTNTIEIVVKGWIRDGIAKICR